MMSDKISDRYVNALAAVAHEIRPTWDEQGIAAAIRKAAAMPKCRDDAQLAVVVVMAAAEVTNRTPAVIPLDGDHWTPPVRPIERALTSGPTCTVCPRCRKIADEGHACGRRERSAEAERLLAEARERAAEASEAIRKAGDEHEARARSGQ